jgi:hypothetical protein
MELTMTFWKEDPQFKNRHLYKQRFLDFDQRKITLDELANWYFDKRNNDVTESNRLFNLRHYNTENPEKSTLQDDIPFIKKDLAAIPPKVGELLEALGGIICDLDYASYETSYGTMTDEQARFEIKRRMDVILNFKDSDIENI